MNFRDQPELCNRLAAEYVLGTLRGGALRRFESLLRRQPQLQLQQQITEWQNRLHPFAELAPALQPPARVWQKIESCLNLPAQAVKPATPHASWWQRLTESLNFWRGLGVASTALAALLVTLMLDARQDAAHPNSASSAPPEVVASTPAINFIATLNNDKAQPIALVTGNAERQQMTIRLLQPAKLAANKSLELWALPKKGAPRSLGLINPDGSITLPLPAHATPEASPLLAISLEPKGGSRNPSKPSGPVVFKGAWLQV